MGRRGGKGKLGKGRYEWGKVTRCCNGIGRHWKGKKVWEKRRKEEVGNRKVA